MQRRSRERSPPRAPPRRAARVVRGGACPSAARGLTLRCTIPRASRPIARAVTSAFPLHAISRLQFTPKVVWGRNHVTRCSAEISRSAHRLPACARAARVRCRCGVRCCGPARCSCSPWARPDCCSAATRPIGIAFRRAGRALAEMVAQAVGSGRPSPIRPALAHPGVRRARRAWVAGAVFDANGAFSPTRTSSASGCGRRRFAASIAAPAYRDGRPAARPLRRPHRHGSSCIRCSTPTARAGAVALLLPARAELLSGGALRLLLPVGLMLLAFIGLTQMTIRWALRPTAEFLERLARALERPAHSGERAAPADEPADGVMERTVSPINELHAGREAPDDRESRARLREAPHGARPRAASRRAHSHRRARAGRSSSTAPPPRCWIARATRAIRERGCRPPRASPSTRRAARAG